MITLLLLGFGPVEAIELQSTTFPEGKTVDFNMQALPGAASGRIKAEVTFKDGQSRIEIDYEDLKPAILFAGDVTCYVLWAVSRDGRSENLGEFLVEEPKGKMTYTTGKKAFALMVTAEPFYLVSRPSSLVTYINAASREKKAPSSPFEFCDLGPSPNPALESITSIAWDSTTPLPLLQARKAYELATEHGAATHANQFYHEAEAALKEANELERKSQKGRKLIDAARRSVALSNEAINIAIRRKEGIEIEKRIAVRRAEMEALEQRAAEAEASAQHAEETVVAARLDMERMSEQTAALREETRQLEAGMQALRQEKQSLEQTKTRLQQEKSDLSERLSGALSHVAETKNSARGYVVNLPDILFDINQATLKSEAKMVLAKLAGILLVIPDLKVTVEGHTDSTGSEEYNLDLSKRRAESVLEFLSGEGVEQARLSSEGFGMGRPIGDNSTAEGRRKNRRVEIVISEE
jgi:outer membrane protein OmpA-like peptidoglycan-associated protein